MVTPEEFLSELERELLKVLDPLDRHKVVLGYAVHMQAREKAIQDEAYKSAKACLTLHGGR